VWSKLIWLHLYSLGLSSFNFCGGHRKRMHFETACIMVVRSYPMSLILVSIESAYATCCWSSVVTLALICPVSEILQVFCWEERPHSFSTQILGVFPMDNIDDVENHRSQDCKLINHVFTFEVSQPIRPRYLNVTNRWTDWRTDDLR